MPGRPPPQWRRRRHRTREQKAQKIEQKGEQKADSLEQKADKTRANAEQKADKVRAGETTGSKMDSAWDKTKSTTKEVGNKVKDAVTPDKEKAEMAVDVRGAQQALRDKGFDPGPIDGRMGPRTAAAVREFQSKEGIIATGQLDAETRGRLMTSSTDSSAPAASPATSRATTAPSPRPSLRYELIVRPRRGHGACRGPVRSSHHHPVVREPAVRGSQDCEA